MNNLITPPLITLAWERPSALALGEWCRSAAAYGGYHPSALKQALEKENREGRLAELLWRGSDGPGFLWLLALIRTSYEAACKRAEQKAGGPSGPAVYPGRIAVNYVVNSGGARLTLGYGYGRSYSEIIIQGGSSVISISAPLADVSPEANEDDGWEDLPRYLADIKISGKSFGVSRMADVAAAWMAQADYRDYLADHRVITSEGQKLEEPVESRIRALVVAMARVWAPRLEPLV